MDKLENTFAPSLCVRYAHNAHAVPDLKETKLSRNAADAMGLIVREYNQMGHVSDEFLKDNLMDSNVDEQEKARILLTLYRSKSLSGGALVNAKHAITLKHNNNEKRLQLILGEVNAGNDNLEIKREGKKIADQLRRANRIDGPKYRQILQDLHDPR